ncbi:MAG: type II toxin-antitoxin system RelE/ParE family toxin [Rhodomicrobium sp.]
MKISYSPRAVADLASIAGYLVERNPRAAVTVELRIREVVDRLAEFPRMGRALAQRPAVRMMPLGRYPYILFYTAAGDELIVLHIRHGSRRPSAADEM